MNQALHEIDRISPTLRPDKRARGHQQWRTLLFMHWQVPVQELREIVPRSLDLDLFDGRAYVGVVPFSMFGVRPRWCPRSLAFDFLETNVRTYVVCKGKPGVYFFSLDAASGLAVWAARRFWGLPYFHADMKVIRETSDIRYELVRRTLGHKLSVHYSIGEELGPSEAGSFQFFLLERYLLFCERRSKIYSGQVHHSPYPAFEAEVHTVNDELVAATGLTAPARPPDHVHFSPGVDVDVFQLEPV